MDAEDKKTSFDPLPVLYFYSFCCNVKSKSIYIHCTYLFTRLVHKLLENDYEQTRILLISLTVKGQC